MRTQYNAVLFYLCLSLIDSSRNLVSALVNGRAEDAQEDAQMIEKEIYDLAYCIVRTRVCITHSCLLQRYELPKTLFLD
jgi:hypothetical protein